MTHCAHEGVGQISRLHNAALCKEIGERLRASLNQEPVRMPPHLAILMAQLRDEPGPIRPM
jgi:hypothetical protein